MADHALLTAEAHRELRVRADRGEELGDNVMCCITFPVEFRRVQNDYPILFRLNAERDAYTAFAIFGFQNGENLFLSDGRWDAHYVPLAIDIQPFLIGRSSGASETKQVHIDLGSPRIARDEGVRVFDQDGRPTPYLESIADKLGALDEGYQQSGDFLDALRRHKLIEPLTLEITLQDGSTNRMLGFHTIDEDRLRALDAAALGELHAAGHLMPIFMAVASLANIGKLVERKNRSLQHG